MKSTHHFLDLPQGPGGPVGGSLGAGQRLPGDAPSLAGMDLPADVPDGDGNWGPEMGIFHGIFQVPK